MSFRISRSSGIEPSRRRSLSQQRPDHSGLSSLSDYRTPSSSVVATNRRPYPSSSSAASSSYYNPSTSSSYLRNGGSGAGARGSPYISKYSNYDNGVTTAGLSLSSVGNGSSWYPGGSNQSLNTLTTPSTSSLYRSHSLREQERKSRSRNRTAVANKIMAASSSTAKRSQSCSSEKSEGYEVRMGVGEC